MAGANTQPTPTDSDTTNTEPQSSLGLSLTAVNTEGPAGPQRAPKNAIGRVGGIAISLPPVLLLLFRPWNLESQQ